MAGAAAAQAGTDRARARPPTRAAVRLLLAHLDGRAPGPDVVTRLAAGAADSIVAGYGTVVAEFFDAGCSRRLPWSSWPEAAALLAELSSTGRRFDAVVIGEYERAFAGNQFAQVSALLRCFAVQVWLPEAGGAVDLDDPMHRALVTVLGAQSQREVLRSRHRVLAAMRAQAREQGRYLGGRPP